MRTYSYDAAGNTSGFTGDTFTYNQRGRLATATVSGGSTTYLYNALGQLIEKTGNGGTTLLVYDEAGHLLGEYTSSGALVQETIWLDDLPVATLRPNGSTVSIYYVQSDHLGTPRKIINPADNSVVWRWDPDTFGGSAPSIATISYNLRFPGQYYLSETGLYYNYYRDYDPATGRYVESDPLGIKAGVNTYAYVKGDPVTSSDPLGLLIRGPGWDGKEGDKEWHDIQNAEARIRAELKKGCSCTRNGGMGSCVPCNLIPILLNQLDTMVIGYAPLAGDCAWTPPSKTPHGVWVSEASWGKVPGKTCEPGCLTSMLYHELLHTTNLIFDDSDPPAAVYEENCIGDLCKKGSP